MAEVLHGDASGNQLNARADKSQVYGLKGNDTLTSSGKSDVLLIGGSGDDSLIMSGGNGTLAGGGGSDVFELNYSATKPLFAVIEDLEPARGDKIVVNFDGDTVPQLTPTKSGSDVILSDGTLLNVTLKGVRDNDYFDGTGNAEQDNRFFEILKLTNDERENPTMPKEPPEGSEAHKKYEEEYDRQQTLVADAKSRNLPWLTLSDGLTKAASIRAQELTTKPDHSRPESVGGGGYSTVFDEVGKHYPNNGENITAGSSTAAEAMTEWIGSLSHHKNILSVDPEDDSSVDYQKLGVGYAFVEEGSLSSEEHYYWEQLFGGSLSETETVTVDSLLAAASVISIGTVSAVVTLTEGNDTCSNSVFGATIAALGGNDSICNSGFNVSISGGNDNDTIDNSGSFTTINAGLGNDRINLNAAQEVLIQYAGGNDTISGFNASDTFSLSGGEYTPVTVDKDVVVSLGADSITFADAASLTSPNILGGTRSKLYVGTPGNDIINVTGVDNATIQALGGNDIINGFDDNDTLQIADDKYYSVRSDDGDLILRGNTNSITLTGAAGLSTINIVDAGGNTVTVGSIDDAKNIVGTDGADSLNNTFDGATIRALGGDDTVTNFGASVSINGGTGNDSVNNNNSRRTVYFYESGDDTISGFDDDDTLNIGSYSYTTEQSGNDIVVNVIDNTATVGTVTLKDCSGLNIENPGYRPPHVPGESISNYYSDTVITGTPNDDTINNSDYGYNVTIDALGGNDSINNWGYTDTVGSSSYTYNVSINAGDGYDTIDSGSDNSTILGGLGNDSIWNQGRAVLVEGGTGNDTIAGYIRDEDTTGESSSYSTLLGGAGNDHIDNHGYHALIEGGTGNDTIWNYKGDDEGIHEEYEADYSTLLGGNGNDYIDNHGNNVLIDGGADNDTIYSTGPDNVTIDGGAGNDYIGIEGMYITVNGDAGDDSISMSDSAFISIYCGTGNDSLRIFACRDVTIDSGLGNDYIGIATSQDSSINAGASDDIINVVSGSTNVSINGGTGDDRISLSADSQNNLVRYTLGDGNDTVWGISENDTLNLPLDAELNPANSRLTSLKNAQGDLIIRVRRNDNNEITGSIILVGAADHPPKITYGESNTPGGGSVGNDSDGGSSQGNGGDRGGNQPGGNTSGGTSSNEGRESAASGGRSASGSSGRSSSSNVSSGGNSFRYTRNEHSTTANATTATANTIPEAVAQLNHQTTANATQTTSTTSTQRIYTGGNQVIGDYTSGERIVFGAQYTGAFYDGNGNFFAGSTTGALVVQNATDKVVDLTDAAGNSFVKAYSATTAGVIDGRGLAGFEVINGSAGSDAIYAGDGGSQLWGGADTVSDAMMGGGGTDIFIGGRTQGADFFLNASSADIVHLNDSALSDIVATAEENGTIGIAFNTGNVVAIQSSEALSATVMLADGSAYKYNHANKSWQNA